MTPENNTLQLDNGDNVQYEYLIVAPGIQLNWHEIKGLKETLGKNNVCSNYSFEQAPILLNVLRISREEKLFSQSPNPGKVRRCTTQDNVHGS